MFRAFQGLRVQEVFSGSANQTITLTKPANTVTIMNNSGADITVTINSLTFTVKDLEVLDEAFDSFKTITVVATGNYRIYTRG